MAMKTALERLLAFTSYNLEVWRTVVPNEENKFQLCVKYKNASIKGTNAYNSVFGIGDDLEAACEDYLDKISGQVLTFNAWDEKKKKEITIL